MAELAAIRNALYLFHMPSQVRQARSGPLPHGIPELLEVAAGEQAITDDAAEALKRSADVLREAAAFFIEQVLLAPEADSYRVLGGTRTTSSTELRRNMALLLRWTHPDADRPGTRTAFANRVTKAWENLKTQERRENYNVDAAAPTALLPRPPGRAGLLRRTLSYLFNAKR